TWANLESGGANPTLAVVVRAAAALQVSVEELIGPPRGDARLIAADALPQRHRGAVLIRELLPEPIPGLQIERLELPPGAAMSGIPHTAGTREYLTCERGEIDLAVAGKRWQLGAGDVVVFRGDQHHGYAHRAGTPAVAYSLVVLAPVPRDAGS
ncbi:MAG: cupin domain-containing protein, partial [Myxococcota bacterium]